MGSTRITFGSLVVIIACFVMVGAARPDLIVTNNAGVKAGITGIIFRPASTNGPASIAVQWIVFHPTSTNATSFSMQQSSNMTNWVDSTPTNTVTGTGAHTGEASDLPNPTNRFYRMHLINFR
jgi:hypothetical protein